MRITLATLKFGEVPYLRYSAMINRSYCQQHGYRFEVICPERQIERSPLWFKVNGVLELLHDSDFVLFMDADAYVVNRRRTVDDLIAEFLGAASFLIGTDRVNKSFAFSDYDANSGVFLVRHSDVGFKILADWWEAPIRHDKRWLWKWPPEQSAFVGVTATLKLFPTST